MGAEFVGKVVVGVDRRIYITEPTIWRFDKQQQQQQIETLLPNNVKSVIMTDCIAIDPAPGARPQNYSQDTANIITLTISNELGGLISDSIRLEAISQNPLMGAIDIGEGGNFILVPSFPTCQVEPAAGRPGDTFVVHATELVPKSDVHAILGDKVAKGITDTAGNVFLQFRATYDTTPGVRLITVRTAALTGDCTLKIIPSEIFLKFYCF